MGKMDITFGDMLMLYRKRKKLTIAEVAKEVGVSAVTISNYEHNRSLPSFEVFQRLARVIGAPVNDLMLRLKEQEEKLGILRLD